VFSLTPTLSRSLNKCTGREKGAGEGKFLRSCLKNSPLPPREIIRKLIWSAGEGWGEGENNPKIRRTSLSNPFSPKVRSLAYEY
jgi:hypothetical protein